METLTLADDVLAHNFKGIKPLTKFERDVLAGEVLARVETVRLGHDVFRLFRLAGRLKDDETIATRYPASKIWELDITKVSAYLTRVLGDEFTKETLYSTWQSAMNSTRTACDKRDATDSVDIALRLRGSVDISLRATRDQPAAHAEAWKNFQMALRVLGPIFSGEVKRADLSA